MARPSVVSPIHDWTYHGCQSPEIQVVVQQSLGLLLANTHICINSREAKAKSMEDLPQAAPPGQLEAKCTEAH